MRQQLKFKETEIGIFPGEWPLLTVDDIKANEKKAIISGPFGSNISSKYFVESGVPVIRGNNLSTGMTRFIDDGFVFVTPEKAEELGTWAARGDIIFTAAGTLGQVGIIEEDSKYEKYVISNKQLRLRVNSALVRPLFAFYWFSSPEMVKYIQQRDTGSTIPLINLSVLKSLPIVVPPVEVQDEIVNILDSLDKKIFYNKSTNLTLEKIGKAFFKHWFIEFEFPNEKGKPFKSSGGEMDDSELGEIPKGWEVNLVTKLFRLEYGWHLPEWDRKEGNVPVFGSGGLTGFHDTFFVEGPGIIVGRAGKIGSGSIYYSHINFCPIETTFYVSFQNKKFAGYLYFLLKTIDTVNTGSSVPNLSRKDIHNAKVLIPPIDLIERLDDLIQPFFELIYVNEIVTKKLSDMRDSLLPKLMSGRIRVGMAK
jgi:type I restriction enzyme S subunit